MGDGGKPRRPLSQKTRGDVQVVHGVQETENRSGYSRRSWAVGGSRFSVESWVEVQLIRCRHGYNARAGKYVRLDKDVKYGTTLFFFTVRKQRLRWARSMAVRTPVVSDLEGFLALISVSNPAILGRCEDQ